MSFESRKKQVRIAVVGDEKAGKTSLVIAATNESFPDVCPPVVPPTIFPCDTSIDEESYHVIDTSSRPEDFTVVEQICSSADVVVICFDCAQSKSFQGVKKRWLPELRRWDVHVPIILVATKTDLIKEPEQFLHSVAQPLLQQFKEVDACLYCSAKRLINTGEVFYHAVRAVNNPVAPLFDPDADKGMGGLRPLCIRALRRIFLMNDLDRDGALNDEELNNFQVKCFSAPLQSEELLGVRRMVADGLPEGVNAIGLTLPGFLYLHALFIERGRLETVWAVLRKYGYNNDLNLNQEVLSEVKLTHAPDQVVEMTEACRNFWSQKFLEYDKDGDKLLNTSEQLEMFSTSPSGPWKGKEFKTLLVETDSKDSEALTLSGFLSKWAFTTAVDPIRTLAFVHYLGFEGNAAPLFTISKSRRQERKSEQLQRSLVQAFVFLGDGAGKGVLLRGLTGRLGRVDQEGASTSATTVAAEVVHQEGSSSRSCTLVVHEHSSTAVPDFESQRDSLAAADVAAFTFGSSNLKSFWEAHQMLLRIAHASENSLPCVLIAMEEEAGMTQDVTRDCASVCADLELRQPLSVKPDNAADVQEVISTLIHVAAVPEKTLAIPQTASLKAFKRHQRQVRLGALLLGGGLLGGVACYAAYKAFVNTRSMSSEGGTAADSPPPAPAQQMH